MTNKITKREESFVCLVSSFLVILKEKAEYHPLCARVCKSKGGNDRRCKRELAFFLFLSRKGSEYGQYVERLCAIALVQ